MVNKILKPIQSTEYYTLSTTITVSQLTVEQIHKTIVKGGINNAMQWRKTIQASIAKHNKTLPFDVQMDLVKVTMVIERACRPHLYQKFVQMIRLRYPDISEQKVKNLANGKVEQTIKKYSY